MKLKKALKIAKKINNKKWLAVDKDNGIWAFERKPFRKGKCAIRFEWYACATCHNPPYDDFVHLGEYSGKKKWKNTLRKV